MTSSSVRVTIRLCSRVRRAQCAPQLPLQPPIQVGAPPLLFTVAPPPWVHLAHSQVQGAVHLWTQEETIHLTTHLDTALDTTRHHEHTSRNTLFILTFDQQSHSRLPFDNHSQPSSRTHRLLHESVGHPQRQVRRYARTTTTCPDKAGLHYLFCID